MKIDHHPRARRCALIAAALVAASPAFADDARLAKAQDEYLIGHYEAAFALLASLADEGQCDAARVAEQMVRYGRSLYGNEFTVAPERREHWRHAPGCPVLVGAR